MDHPENFTEKEWEEYLDKISFLLPMNDKEWEEFLKLIGLPFSKNPNIKFYPQNHESLRLENAFLQQYKAYRKRHSHHNWYVIILAITTVLVGIIAMITTYLYYSNK